MELTLKEIRAAAVVDMTEAVGRLQDQARGDLTIVCGDQTFRVHKDLISERSEFFKRACQEGKFKAGLEGVITLAAASHTPGDSDFGTDEPEAVRLMIDYVYNNDYTVEPIYASKIYQCGHDAKYDDEDRTLSTHVNVFAVAVKYGMTNLQRLARRYFLDAIVETNHNEYFAFDIADTIQPLYRWTPEHFEEVRKVLSRFILRRPKLLDIDCVVSAIESVEGAWRVMLLIASTMISVLENRDLAKAQYNDWASTGVD
ncbi:hypothetical protein LTR27_006738 [Elasticomyces elasticus]|nr:hypothetical protein LTR27_006738 [Elasticomyces elasticus]